jgi:hypothetical protein
MKIRKYIISDGKLIQGMVEIHAELTSNNPGGKVTGGGIVYFDDDSKSLYLYGSSMDFGQPKMEEVAEAIKTARADIKSVDVYWSPQESLGNVLKTATKIWSKS